LPQHDNRKPKTKQTIQPASHHNSALCSTTPHVVKHPHLYQHQQHHAVSTNPLHDRAIHPFPHPIRRNTAPQPNPALPIFLHTAYAFRPLDHASNHGVQVISDSKNDGASLIAALFTITTAPELCRYIAITTTKIHV
jgi:hypothetical protein